jgi:hypothetical protein
MMGHEKPRPYADGRGSSEEFKRTCNWMNKRSGGKLFPKRRAAHRADQRNSKPPILVGE